MPTFSDVSLQRLLTCDPRLQDILKEAIKIVDFTVMEGHRNEEAQNKAFAEGKSKLKWPNGNHNRYPSRAVDIAPWLPEVKIDWSDMIAFGRLMGVVQTIAFQKGVKLRFGLDWDGDFRSVDRDPTESFMDAPHIELVDPVILGWFQKNAYVAIALAILLVIAGVELKVITSQAGKIGTLKAQNKTVTTERDQAKLDLSAKTQVAEALRVSLDDALDQIRVGKNTQDLAAQSWKQDYDRLIKEAAVLRRNLNGIYSSTPTCTSLADLDIAAACPAAASGLRERARRMSAP